MRIKFLGTGGAFDYEFGNSAAWLEWSGRRILIDCGSTVYGALRRACLSDQIDHILITHLHDDHVGSLNTTILHGHFFLNPPRKINILVPSPEFKAQVYAFLQMALIKPEDFVSFTYLDQLPGITYIDTKDLHVKGMQTYGFIFEDKEEILAYSGDLGDPNIVFSHLPQNSPKKIRVFHETSFERNPGIHTYYQDLAEKLDQYDIFAYHINPRDTPTDNRIPLVAHYPDLLAKGVLGYPPASKQTAR